MKLRLVTIELAGIFTGTIVLMKHKNEMPLYETDALLERMCAGLP